MVIALARLQHVTIFVNTDVDALNAYFILSVAPHFQLMAIREGLTWDLQYILKCEHITYSMSPVVGKADLVAAIAEHSHQVLALPSLPPFPRGRSNVGAALRRPHQLRGDAQPHR